VARSYRVSQEQLATVNQLHANDSLASVDALVVPVPPVASPVTHAEVYKARRGDTLVKIADRFGVSLEDLHRWNHVTGTSVAAGQRIRVTEPVHLAPGTREHSHTAAASGARSNAGSKPATAAKSASASGKRSAAAAAKNAASKSGAKRQEASAAHKSGDPEKPTSHRKRTPNKKVEK
jgi:membrane-bound lytic murein transglycosylase D